MVKFVPAIRNTVIQAVMSLKIENAEACENCRYDHAMTGPSDFLQVEDNVGRMILAE